MDQSTAGGVSIGVRVLGAVLISFVLWACNDVLGIGEFKSTVCQEGARQCNGDWPQLCTLGRWQNVGIMALDSFRNLESNCPGGQCLYSPETLTEAHSLGMMSTVGLLGDVGVAAGTVLRTMLPSDGSERRSGAADWQTLAISVALGSGTELFRFTVEGRF
ncbi:hypothetical protein [Sorangium sp. So ce1389]|uniref:hypothetical protein n=1 Tax=Sorangium sp. So ce1389 TaxID=3133336 RepID=UPI003F63C9BB